MPIMMVIMKKSMTRVGGMWGNGTLTMTAANAKQRGGTGKQLGSASKSNTGSLCDPAIPLLPVYQGELKSHVHKKPCTQTFTVALFIMVKRRNRPKSNG